MAKFTFEALVNQKKKNEEKEKRKKKLNEIKKTKKVTIEENQISKNRKLQLFFFIPFILWFDLCFVVSYITVKFRLLRTNNHNVNVRKMSKMK